MNWSGRKVLITGGLGFLGSNLVVALLRQGAVVTVLDSLDVRSGSNRANLSDVLGDVRVIEGDICNPEACADAVAGQDCVIHCAALTSHPQSQRDPVGYATVNSIGTLVLLEALRKTNPGARLVALGTSTQIGEMVTSPIDERHGEFPTDFYSATKTASEKYVLTLARAHGLNATVVRLGNIYGPRAHVHTPNLGFVNFFIGLGLQDKDITVYGDGKQQRNLSYVDDCVETILRVAGHDKSAAQVYFATGDQHFSVAEIAEDISRHVGGRVRLVPWPKDRLVLEAGDAVISNDKLKAAIGAPLSTAIADGLQRTAAYYRSRLADYLPA
jgi:UDP-glucose 4-epimerase